MNLPDYPGHSSGWAGVGGSASGRRHGRGSAADGGRQDVPVPAERRVLFSSGSGCWIKITFILIFYFYVYVIETH